MSAAMIVDRIAVAALGALLVAGCGGSGGGGTTPSEEGPLLDGSPGEAVDVGAPDPAETDVPSGEAPELVEPDPVEPEAPAGESPELVEPDPVEPEGPAGEAPELVEPDPVEPEGPAGESPEPVEPDPIEPEGPAGESPELVEPDPIEPEGPAGEGPELVEPDPVEPEAPAGESPELVEPGPMQPDRSPDETAGFDVLSASAVYAVTLENFWNADDFPQDFPADAHLSFVGGATHNASVSFWEIGTTVTPGVEDMAETGRIELLLDEDVRPAIEAGLADSAIAERRYVGPQVDGVPGTLEFEITLVRPFPRVTLLTMLGPSPDWFVGTDGVPLLVDGAWLDTLTVGLPLLDAGTKSNVTPVMHGPGIHPPDPVGTIAYDPANGTYQPSATPQVVARIVFVRTR